MRAITASSLLDVLDQVISRSSIQLRRLRRIAKSSVVASPDHRSWMKPAAMPRRTLSPARAINIRYALPSQAAHQNPTTSAPMPKFYQSGLPIPAQVALVLPPPLASRPFEPLPLAAGHIQAGSRQVGGISSNHVGTAAVASFQPNQTPEARSNSPVVDTRRPAPWLVDLSPIYGRYPSPHQRRSALISEDGRSGAVRSRQQVENQAAATGEKLTETATIAVSIVSRSPTTAASSTTRGSHEWDPSLGSGTGNRRQTGQGELILEGSTLSRWLTQKLNQAMTRPPVGITGVDPRIAPAWTGPSSGL